MRRFLVCFVIAITLTAPVLAQESDICSPEDVQARVDEAYQTYSISRELANDTSAALDELNRLQDALNKIVDLCSNVATDTPSDVDAPGSGTQNDPYAFGVAGDTGQGFSLQMTGLIRPADRIIRNENMFNDKPKADEMYVVLNLKLQCYEDTSGTCEASRYYFQMVGDKGVIYDVPYVVFDDIIEVKVLGGTSGEGSLPFLVKKDDTNLRLIYRPNSFMDDNITYFAAEPSMESGVEVTASTGINVRIGPGTNFGVATNLAANTPVIAFGRNADSTWLQIAEGWVFRELVTINGDVDALPVTSQ